MITTIWSVKGGSGVSVVAAALAVVLARRHGDALIVDLAGDQPAVLGLREPSGPGVRDWLATPDGSAAALDRLVITARPSLGLLPTGTALSWEQDRGDELVGALATVDRPVVVDGGLLADPAPRLAAAGASLLVVRPCYLALRRAVRSGVQADGVVVVADPGRALDDRDVERSLGLPVVCTIPTDPAVARAVDAGVIAARVPRLLERSLRGIT